jgi:hypothetical protein
MPAVSKAQQKFMGMVHAAQKGEKPASKDVKKAADNMSDKSAKDFASTKHKGLPSHVKEGDVTTKPEVPTDDDFDGLPSAAIVGVSAEGITDTQSTSAPKPQPTNGILWKATGRVCEGRSMAERVNMYEKKGGGWRMGKAIDETVYTTLKEFYKNEIKPRKEAKELIVKRRMGEGTGREAKEIAGLTGTRDSIVQKFIDDYNLNSKKLFNFISKGKEKIRKDFATAMSGRPGNRYQGDFVGMFGESIVNEAAPLYKDWDEFVNPHYILVTLKNGKKLKIEKKNVKGGTNVYHAILKAFNDNNHKITNKVVSGMLDRLGESVNETTLNEDDMQEPGGDVVSTNGVQDHEVSMAKASLMSIGKAVQDLMGRLGDQEKDIPGWIQDHITNAENYIVQASKGYYDQQDKKLGNNIPRPENQPTTQSNGK